MIDTHFRFEGPVVAQLIDVFADDWAFTTGEQLAGDRGHLQRRLLDPADPVLVHQRLGVAHRLEVVPAEADQQVPRQPVSCFDEVPGLNGVDRHRLVASSCGVGRLRLERDPKGHALTSARLWKPFDFRHNRP